MPFKGPYPTKFSGHTTAMIISGTTFSGGVTNAGTIGAGGISVISSTFLTAGLVDTGLISARTPASASAVKTLSMARSSTAAPSSRPR